MSTPPPSKLPAHVMEDLATQFHDETPTGQRIMWCHHDVLMSLRADEAIASAKETDFRMRAYHQRRELLLYELIMAVREEFLPEGRE